MYLRCKQSLTEFFQKIPVSKIRFLILCVIIKTPSSVQNCHEVNQS